MHRLHIHRDTRQVRAVHLVATAGQAGQQLRWHRVLQTLCEPLQMEHVRRVVCEGKGLKLVPTYLPTCPIILIIIPLNCEQKTRWKKVEESCKQQRLLLFYISLILANMILCGVHDDDCRCADLLRSLHCVKFSASEGLLCNEGVLALRSKASRFIFLAITIS